MTSLTVTINGRAYGPQDVRDDLTMNDFLREYLGMTGTKFSCGAAARSSSMTPTARAIRARPASSRP
jgi:aerobic-type carbon monoxide dehydrogenase small subunit (CoxS/CutS family)